MKVSLDPSKYNTDVVPEDTYEVVITKMSKKDSESGNRQGYFTAIIQEGEFAKRSLVTNITVTENTLWKANELYKACTGEDMPQQEFESEDEFLDWLFEEVNGESCLAVVTHREYQGQTRVNVSFKAA